MILLFGAVQNLQKCNSIWSTYKTLILTFIPFFMNVWGLFLSGGVIGNWPLESSFFFTQICIKNMLYKPDYSFTGYHVSNYKVHVYHWKIFCLSSHNTKVIYRRLFMPHIIESFFCSTSNMLQAKFQVIFTRLKIDFNIKMATLTFHWLSRLSSETAQRWQEV